MKSLFKFNKNSTGIAAHFSYGAHRKTNDIVLFLKFVRQTSWNGKNGSSKGGAESQIMLNPFECAGLLAALETSAPEWKTFHSQGDSKAQLTVKFVEGRGFSVQLFKNNENFNVGMSAGEARLLAISLEANLALDATQWINRQSAPPQEEIAYEE